VSSVRRVGRPGIGLPARQFVVQEFAESSLASGWNCAERNGPEPDSGIPQHDEVLRLAEIDEIFPLVIPGALVPCDRHAILSDDNVALEIDAVQAAVESFHPDARRGQRTCDHAQKD